MFQSSVPVVHGDFHDRVGEIRRIEEALDRLEHGAPRWLAVVGPRKVGKTSLLLEAARRARGPAVRFVVLDVLDTSPVSLEFFRLAGARILDALLDTEIGGSLELLLGAPTEFRQALQESKTVARLSPALRGRLLDLPTMPIDDAAMRFVLDLPERLAEVLDVRVLLAIDEFQELASLGARDWGETRGDGRRGTPDPFPIARSVWQRHRRVTYVVSGSARTMLTELVTSERSPFFQHFTLAEIGPFAVADAVELLVREGPRGRRIPVALARRAVEILGGHPFYLQVFGESLVAREPPYDDRTLKETLQEVLFTRTGRLALYFENEHARMVGRSSLVAAVLDALASGPRRLGEVATAIGQASGSTAQYLKRLADAVRKRDDGLYEITDPVLARWLAWRRPGGSAVPMTLLGDEGERIAAAHVARMGFDLVYQSRASRGAFDLLALRGASPLGIQVKRSSLPLRFAAAEWNRMEADARRLGWRWIVIAVDEAGRARALDPARARRGRERRLGDESVIDNLLAWVDADG